MKKLTLGLTFLFISFISISQIINIPADYPTIQQGIDVANNGDTVLVQPGTYQESINFTGKNITLGSLFLTTQDTSYISHTIIDGNQNGTVVTFENGESSNAVLIGFVITNGNSASSGGGIKCIYGSNPHFENLIITDNSAEYNGGGIICGGMASPSLKNVIIADNDAGGDGGGIYCYNYSSPSLENVVISGNNSIHGGGICCLENSSPAFDSVLITNNDASEGGGICAANNSNLELNVVNIEDNNANDGGGIYLHIGSAIINQSNISNNTALRGGGIFCENQVELNLDSTSVFANEASNKGAGIYAFNTRLYIEDCLLSENEISGGQGGAIYFYADGELEILPEVVMNNTIISDNIGIESGAAAGANFLKSSDSPPFNIHIEDCIFDNNVSLFYSGLRITGVDLGFEVINCTFSNNISENFCAGAAFTSGCSGQVTNCLFASNIANQSGEEWNSGAVSVWNLVEVDLVNCSFVNNSAFYGSALTAFASEVLLLNSIVWDNENNQITLLDNEEIGSSLIVGYSNIHGGEESIELGELSELNWAGGNIHEDPIFMNSGDHPYSLDMGSPCIDTGTPDSVSYELPEGDCMGNIRVWDGDGDYIAVVDMGPYEYGSIPVNIETHGEAKNHDLAAITYPNPFTNLTTIEYELTQPALIQISIYDYLGKQVKTIEQRQQPGKQQVLWDAADLPAGTYYFVLKTESGTQTIKLIKL